MTRAATCRSIVAGLCALPTAAQPAPTRMTAGRSLRGIVEGDASSGTFIPHLIEVWRDGRFPFDRLVRFYDLHRINEALEDAEAGRVVKPVIRMPA